MVDRGNGAVDALGYRTVVTDANGAVTRYSYDGLNRLSAVHYVSDAVTVTYRYNALGRRTAMTDTLGTTTYVYDELGRLVSVNDPLTGAVEYAYDLIGNRTGLIYPSGKTVTYTCNADNRLVRVEDWDGGLTGYAYDEVGRLVTTTLPNSVITFRQYDGTDRLVRLTHSAADDTVLSDYQYQLDGVGNRVRVTETLTDTTRVITNTYDPLDRLIGSEHSTGESFAYVYDGLGNRTAYTATITQTVITTYTYDKANRLTKRVEDGSDTYLYTWSDANRLIREEWNGYAARTFAYDAAGRLITVVIPGFTTTFQYDGDGHRLVKTVNGELVTYTLDYANNAYLLFEQSITATRHYLHGKQCIGEQDTETQEWSYYLGDGQRRVRQVADETGLIKFGWLYTSLGEVLSGPKGYYVLLDCPDGVYDWSTGLIFVNGRYFDPTLGLWIGLASLIVLQSWRGNKKKRRKRVKYALVLLAMCVAGWLAACKGDIDFYDIDFKTVRTTLGGRAVFKEPCEGEVKVGVDKVKTWQTDPGGDMDITQQALNAAVDKFDGDKGFGNNGSTNILDELKITSNNPLEFYRIESPPNPDGIRTMGRSGTKFFADEGFFYDNYVSVPDEVERAGTITHEFAHLWDDIAHSNDMLNSINFGEKPTMRAEKSPVEDWAESVELYFWPEKDEYRRWTDDLLDPDQGIFGKGSFEAVANYNSWATDGQWLDPEHPDYNFPGGPSLDARVEADWREEQPPAGMVRAYDRYDYIQWVFGHGPKAWPEP